MNFIVLLSIFCIKLIVAPYPGEDSLKKLYNHYAKFRFNMEAFGGDQNQLLSIYYMDYFTAKSEKIARKMELKIAIFSHIFLLKWKIGQHRETLQKIYSTYENNPQKLFVYNELMQKIHHITNNVFHQQESEDTNVEEDEMALCHVLMVKFELYRALNWENKGEFKEMGPKCQNGDEVRESLEKSRALIRQWVLSDVLHFMGKRRSLIQYFVAISRRNDQVEILEIRQKFIELLGVPGMVLICTKFYQFLSFLVPNPQGTQFYEEVYESLFDITDEDNRFLSKLILDKLLYDEWVDNFFKSEFGRKNHRSEQFVEMRNKFLTEMQEFWKTIDQNFWEFEKMIRAIIEQDTTKKNRDNLQNIGELMRKMKPKDKQLMLLWEDAPTDMSLFRALAICTKNTVNEYNLQFRKIYLDAMEDLSEFEQIKWYICIGKNLKNSKEKDGILAKLHLEKIIALIKEAKNDKFLEKLRENRQSWKDFLDSDGLKKVDELLKEDYLSAVDSSADENNNFVDAIETFEGPKTQNLNKENPTNTKRYDIADQFFSFNKKLLKASKHRKYNYYQPKVEEKAEIISNKEQNISVIEKSEKLNQVVVEKTKHESTSGKTDKYENEEMNNVKITEIQNGQLEKMEEVNENYLTNSANLLVDKQSAKDLKNSKTKKDATLIENTDVKENSTNISDCSLLGDKKNQQKIENSEKMPEKIIDMDADGKIPKLEKFICMSDPSSSKLKKKTSSPNSPFQYEEEEDDDDDSEGQMSERSSPNSQSSNSLLDYGDSSDLFLLDGSMHFEGDYDDQKSLKSQTNSETSENSAKMFENSVNSLRSLENSMSSDTLLEYDAENWPKLRKESEKNAKNWPKLMSQAPQISIENSCKSLTKKIPDQFDQTMNKFRQWRLKKKNPKRKPVTFPKLPLTPCRMDFKDFGFQKLEDLTNEQFIDILYRNYLEIRLKQDCEKYLHIPVLILSIQAKIRALPESVKNFEEKWTEFVSKESEGIEDVQFLLDKLFFVHISLENLLSEPSNIRHLEKAVDILEQNKLELKQKHSSESSKLLYQNQIRSEPKDNFIRLSEQLTEQSLNKSESTIREEKQNTDLIEESTLDDQNKGKGKPPEKCNQNMVNEKSANCIQNPMKITEMENDQNKGLTEELKRKDQNSNINSSADPSKADHKRSSESEADQDQQLEEEEIHISQFGSYQMANFDYVLQQLHNNMYMLLASKNGIDPNNLYNKMKGKKYEWKITKLIGRKILIENWIRSTLKVNKVMLEQQKLVDKYMTNQYEYELSQYSMFQTNAMLKEKDTKFSIELSRFILLDSINIKRKNQFLIIRQSISNVVDQWVKGLIKIPRYSLVPTGSFMLSAEVHESDLDLLCVVPNRIGWHNFNGSSDDSLFSRLSMHFGNPWEKVTRIPGRVPLIQIQSGDMKVDLLFVPVPQVFVYNGKLHSDDVVRAMNNEAETLSIAGYRAGKFQLELVPDQLTFSALLRAVKIWAKKRLIYSGLFGYLNGAALTIMATKICALFPDAPTIFLLQKFFAIYSKWDWSKNALLLQELSPISLNPVIHSWNPAVSRDLMSVITPKFPEQNTTFNVNKFTLKTIVEELQIAHNLLSEYPKKWRNIFVQTDYQTKYGHFAIIACWSTDYTRYEGGCEQQKTQIRKNLLEWAGKEDVASIVRHYHAIPNYEEKRTCNLANKIFFCTTWLIGLTLDIKEHKAEMLLTESLAIYSPEEMLDGTSLWSIFVDAADLNQRLIDLYAHH